MRIESKLCHISENKAVVQVNGWLNDRNLGSALAENLTSLKDTPKLLMLGIKDNYSKGGEYKFLLIKHRLTSEKIVEDVIFNYNSL